MKKIYITPLERIGILQRENSRLRALIGEPDPVNTTETPEGRGEHIEAPTLIGNIASVKNTANIAFVTMAETGAIDEVTATEHFDVFAPWVQGTLYAVGSLRAHKGKLYKCVQAHKSQGDWAPDAAASLWSVAGNPLEEWPAWSQPVGAHDAYDAGDKVSHQNKHWVSTADANVWEPGAAGIDDTIWREVVE